LPVHLANLMAAYYFARRLKTLNGLTPYKYIARSGRQSRTVSLLI